MWKLSCVLSFAAVAVAALAQPALAHQHTATSQRALEHRHRHVVSGYRHPPYWHGRVYAAGDPLSVSEPDCVVTPFALDAAVPRWQQVTEPGQCVAPARHYYWSAAQWRYFWHHPSFVSDWTAYTLGY